MAITPITQRDINRNSPAGLATVYSTGLAQPDTFTFSNDGNVFLHFEKTGAGACTVTVITPGTVAGGIAVADPTYTVPATTGDVMVGPFPPDVFNDPATGLVSFTMSDVVGMSVAAFRLPRS
jgi:hypothetical protein